jgi:hypothetical protein
MLELEDLKTTISILKSMKPYQKIAFFESKDGIDFVNQLYDSVGNKEDKESVNQLHKALGSPTLEKGTISLNDINFYTPTECATPIDNLDKMKSYPDRRLNSDHVYRAVGSNILQPHQYWTKQSDLCEMFHASPESIEAALFSHVGDGRIAYEEAKDQMLFARV